MVPFINVAAKESTLLGPTGTDFCRWEGRGADLTQPAGFTASGSTTWLVTATGTATRA